MKFELNTAAASLVDTDCLVIGVFEQIALQGSAAEVDEASSGALQRLLDSGDIDTDWKHTTLLHGLDGVMAKRILVVGCGNTKKFTRVRYDAVCTSAGVFLHNHATTGAHLRLNELEVEEMSAHWRLRQAAVSLDRANYRYTTTKPLKNDDPEPLLGASFGATDDLHPALDEASGIAKGYLVSRELGNLPPNICNPVYLAEQALEIQADYENVSCEILDQDAMSSLKMFAFLSVGRGSTNPPRMIVLNYQGTGKDVRPIVMVGKGITFDTGGISLKPGPNMEQMKFDMGGAASVMGAFVTCAELQLPINLVCIVAAAENMPDGDAFRPGDVITSMSGKTIEVLNTDAEGRLVLCDALTYSRRFNPTALIDVATLTGACVVALGHHASAIMSKHDDLADELVEAGQEAVDRGWRLPLWNDYQSQLKSTFADMKNVGGMPAGSVTAGCFLSRFTDTMRWAHIDCAGSTWKWGGKEGSTGRPVGLLTQFLINQANSTPAR